MKRKITIFFILVTMCAYRATAQIPRFIVYQAEIKTLSGQLITDGAHIVTITFYDSLTGGNKSFSESGSYTTSKGLLTAGIGITSPIPDSIIFSKPYFYGIAIDNDPEITPRTPFHSFPYALHSQLAKSLSPNAVISPSILPKSFPALGVAGGDLSGSYPGPKVRALQGFPLSDSVFGQDGVLQWDGKQWVMVPYIEPVAFHVFASGIAENAQPNEYYFPRNYSNTDLSSFNQNSFFNNGSGYFTAPYSGEYHFDFYLRFYFDASLPLTMQIGCFVDGKLVGTNQRTISYGNSYYNQLASMQYNTTIRLTAGQKVQIGIDHIAITSTFFDLSGFMIK